MKKIALFLVFVFVFISFVPFGTYATEIANQNVDANMNRIDQIFDEIAFLKSEMSSDDDLTNTALASEICRLENELFTLGVSKVTPQELFSNPTFQDGLLRMGYPSSTSTIDWYSTTVNYTVNNHTYTIQRIYAQGKGDSTSKLKKIGAIAYTPNKINNASASEVVYKIAAALIDLGTAHTSSVLVSYTWSQLNSLLSNALSSRDIGSCSVNYNITSTVCFSYVSSTSTSQQYFCLGTSSMTGYMTIVIASQINGAGEGVYNHTITKKSSEHSNNSGLSKAVSNFTNSSGITCTYSYVDDLKFYEYNSYCKKTIHLSAPSAMAALY